MGNANKICNMDCFNCPFEDCINDKSAENRAENVPFSVRKLSSYENILMEKRGFFNA